MSSKKRALVAEDSLLIVLALESILDHAEIEVAGVASNLAEALTLAQSCDADIAILDVNLGDGMVFPAADILVARGIPIVFATGYATEKALLARYVKAQVIQKPYESEALLKLVARGFQTTTPQAG